MMVCPGSDTCVTEVGWASSSRVMSSSWSSRVQPAPRHTMDVSSSLVGLEGSSRPGSAKNSRPDES